MRTVYSEPAEVADILASLGLTLEQLTDAIIVGEVARDNCTAHHPPYTAGFVAHCDTVRGLRDILVPEGWSADDTANFSTVVEPDGTYCIAIATGDEHTGKLGTGNVPKTKYEAGTRTIAAVTETQYSLFAENRTLAPHVEPGRATWFLLRHRVDDIVHAELSLPKAMEGNRIVDWNPRVILDPIHLDPSGGKMATPEDGQDGGDLDVPVTRRNVR